MELPQKCIHQLEDLRIFLQQINQEQFKKPLSELSKASLGQHTRHILEFYTCLLKSTKEEPSVCYDRRERNPLLENEIPAALQEISEVTERLDKRDQDFALEQIILSDGQDPLSLTSTFFRELWYVYEHTTHHMAILKIASKLMGVVGLPENFGVADSTISYRRSAAH